MSGSAPSSFRAFVAERGDDDVDRGLRTLGPDALGEGDVLVRVAWSSVNYKDALATIPKGRVAQISPLVPGIDLAGTVVESVGDEIADGTEVLAHGYDLGVAHHGGYAEYARVPSAWVVPLPSGLSARQAMAVGTAGYTAAMSVHALEHHGIEPGGGPVLVTGATGGVGSSAVAMLAGRGYEVVASTGKDEADYLRGLGASEVIGRDELAPEKARPLEKSRWDAAVDSVGGAPLAHVIRSLRYGGAVAACGLTAGVDLPTTVHPFILRGVSLLGIDSVHTPIELRTKIWERVAGDLRPAGLEERITSEIALDELEPTLDAILRGEVRGRTVVRVGG
jgi:putative YhdH/YhfP family quinone oxidoreductase